MSSIDEIRDLRIKKLELLRQKGVNPYPADSKRELLLKEAIETFSKLEESKEAKWIAGRIMSIRGQGAIVFITLNDGTGTFQGLLKKDILGEEKLNFFSEVVDIGDFIEIQGTFFTTKRGEKTLEAVDWRMLSKSLRPLPEKWHGLQDLEERFRKRYLDTLMNDEAKERLLLRSRAVALVRKFYNDDGYIEVETPRLQTVAGGATAKPFITHHNALDVDFFLTIAQELYLKMLLVGGFTKVYEIGRKFRNEGIDTTHNPEFTMLESQEVYGNAKTQREFIEKLFKYLIKEIFGAEKVTIDTVELDFEKAFEVITFFDLIKKHTEIKDPASITEKELAEYAQKIGVAVEPNESKENMLDSVYKKLCRPSLVQPTFIIDYPVAFNPFAKRKEDDPTMIDRFQLVISGIELVNAFSELNNPIDQKERYLEQDKKGKKGEEEISPTDMAYLEAMEYGMPPNGGIGIGIDRLTMFLSGAKNIKEVILFPTLKPKEQSHEPKKKETMLAVAVINKGAKLEPWQELNTIAHLNAAFGAHIGKSLFYKNNVTTKDGVDIALNIQHAIMIKITDSSDDLQALVADARKMELEVSEFTREMLQTTNDKKVSEQTSAKNLKDIEHLGVLIFGEKKKVEGLTESLKLYS
ncbi:MAG: lysine--tRNA ligase [bacterium]